MAMWSANRSAPILVTRASVLLIVYVLVRMENPAFYYNAALPWFGSMVRAEHPYQSYERALRHGNEPPRPRMTDFAYNLEAAFVPFSEPMDAKHFALEDRREVWNYKFRDGPGPVEYGVRLTADEIPFP